MNRINVPESHAINLRELSAVYFDRVNAVIEDVLVESCHTCIHIHALACIQAVPQSSGSQRARDCSLPSHIPSRFGCEYEGICTWANGTLCLSIP